MSKSGISGSNKSNKTNKTNISVQNEEVKIDPVDLDLQIQNERILLILDTALEQIKVAVCLPVFLTHESFRMQKYLTHEDADFVHNSCMRYILPTCFTSKSLESSVYSTLIKSITLSKKTKSGTSYYLKNTKFVDLHLKQALEILYQNQKLTATAQEQYKFLVDSYCINFIEIFQRVRAIVSDKLKVSAVNATNREKLLNKAWRENIVLQKVLNEMNKEMTKQREGFTEKTDEKNNTIQKLEIKIRKLNEKIRDKIKNISLLNEVNMQDDQETSKEKQTELANEAKYIQTQYDNLLAQHLTHEKKLRAKKLKVEQQLVSWLAKYDADMTDRQNELDELTAAFDEEHRELVALQEQYDEQLPLHTELMEEKAEKDYKEFSKVVNIFMRNYAAKIVQRWWRKIWPNIKVKKRGKKGKKGAKGTKKKK